MKIIQILIGADDSLYALDDGGSIYLYRPYLDEEKWTKIVLPDLSKIKNKKENKKMI